MPGPAMTCNGAPARGYLTQDLKKKQKTQDNCSTGVENVEVDGRVNNTARAGGAQLLKPDFW